MLGSREGDVFKLFAGDPTGWASVLNEERTSAGATEQGLPELRVPSRTCANTDVPLDLYRSVACHPRGTHGRRRGPSSRAQC